MIDVARQRHVPAPPQVVWSVLADFGAIAGWADDVDHSCLLRGSATDAGIGTVRRIQTGRTTLLETVEVWDHGKSLGYRIEGLPPVVRSVRNEWRLDADPAGTHVVLTTTIDPGPRPPQRLVGRLVARRLARASDALLSGLAAAVSTSADPAGATDG